MATNRAAGPLVGKLGAGRVTIMGLITGMIGFALLAGIDRNSSFTFGILPGLIILPIGVSFIFSGSAVLSTDNVPPHQIGLAGGVMNTAMELGPTAGLAALMSAAAIPDDMVTGYAWAFGTAGAAYLVMALIAVLLIRRSNKIHASYDIREAIYKQQQPGKLTEENW